MRKKIMVTTTTVLTTLVLIACFQSIGFAKTYTRSCGAHYSACPSSFSGRCWQFDFTGKGSIGYYNPNKARERARKNIDECLDTHWLRYTATGKPKECTSANQIYSYPVNSLVVDLSRNLCRLNPGRTSMQVTISTTYSGKKGCTLRNNSWKRIITRNHTVHCPDDIPLY